MLIKRHDYCTGVLWTGHNKRPQCAVLITQYSVMNRVPHGGGGVMVWSGIRCRQQTQLHSIDGNLNAQIYRDEILRPIVMPFIHRHQLMLQHDNARPNVAKISTQFLEAGNILAWPAYSPDMSPIERVWDVLDQHVGQRVPIPANIQ